MRDVVEILISLSAALALIVLYRQSKHTVVNVPITSFLGLFIAVFGGFLYELTFTPRGQIYQLALLSLVAAALLVQLVKNSRELADPHRLASVVIFAAPGVALTCFVVNAMRNPSLPIIESMGRLASVLYLLVLVAFCIASRASLQLVARVIVTSALAILVISPVGSKNWRPCDTFKCGPFDAIYTGPFSSENGLAIILAVGVLSALLTWNGTRTLFLVFPLVLTLFATESRTSQIALAIGVATWFAHRVTARSSNTLYSRMVGTICVMAVILLAAVGLVLTYTSGPSDFSNRGNIWMRGTQGLGRDWITGLGMDRWTYLQKVGFIPPLFPHSQYLLTLFGGGVIACLLLVVMFTYAIKAKLVDAESSFISAYAIFFAVLGLTEAYWNPIAIDGHSFVVIPFIVAILAGKQIHKQSKPRSASPAPKFVLR